MTCGFDGAAASAVTTDSRTPASESFSIARSVEVVAESIDPARRILRTAFLRAAGSELSSPLGALGLGAFATAGGGGSAFGGGVASATAGGGCGIACDTGAMFGGGTGSGASASILVEPLIELALAPGFSNRSNPLRSGSRAGSSGVGMYTGRSCVNPNDAELRPPTTASKAAPRIAPVDIGKGNDSMSGPPGFLATASVSSSPLLGPTGAVAPVSTSSAVGSTS